jgi:hypothetical protein
MSLAWETLGGGHCSAEFLKLPGAKAEFDADDE